MAATNTTAVTSTAGTTQPTSANTPATTTDTSGASGSNPLSGFLPTFPTLAEWAGLPSVIDWQDLAIRVGMVIVGIVLLFLVAWAFVRGEQKTTVNVQVPPGGSVTKEAEEAAEMGA
jgi:hypothetical protein